MKRAVIITLLILACQRAAGEIRINSAKIADAIYLAEGGKRARVPYGVLSVKVKDEAEARRVCIRTVEHAWDDYSELSAQKRSQVSFVHFLADRYCPPGVDRIGNRNWKRNVNFFLK